MIVDSGAKSLLRGLACDAESLADIGPACTVVAGDENELGDIRFDVGQTNRGTLNLVEVVHLLLLIHASRILDMRAARQDTLTIHNETQQPADL